MEGNVFLDKSLFYTHQNKDFRERRLKDFEIIYQKLKPHLTPTDFVEFDEKIKKRYIEAHKKINRPAVQELFDSIKTAKFTELQSELINFAKNFKVQKFIYVVGATSDKGENAMNFDLFKSNLWTFMLMYDYLPYKPYDIILNLSTGIRLYYDECKDFLITDDASYSGEQLINNIIKPAAVELSFTSKKEGYKIVEPMFRVVSEKLCNLHLIVPYISNVVFDKLNTIDATTGFCVKRYNAFVILALADVLSNQNYRILSHLYNQFYPHTYFGNLIPFHFDYKIADMISTLELVLVKGKVLDDPTKRIMFLKNCKTAALFEKTDCPVPPYKKFYLYLSGK